MAGKLLKHISRPSPPSGSCNCATVQLGNLFVFRVVPQKINNINLEVFQAQVKPKSTRKHCKVQRGVGVTYLKVLSLSICNYPSDFPIIYSKNYANQQAAEKWKKREEKPQSLLKKLSESNG